MVLVTAKEPAGPAGHIDHIDHSELDGASGRASTSVVEAPKATFSPEEVAVIFVLGGPGAGKGTQCTEITTKMPDFVHLSAGDLLREERSRSDSKFGALINHHIREGTIVPMQITISLLERAMLEHPQCRAFLIDGFPRNVAQGIAFEAQVCPCREVLFFDCPEDILIERVLGRAASSGRDDDNMESIKKRLVTYRETTLPVISHYESQAKVHKIDCCGSIQTITDAVLSHLCSKLNK
jgi:UMP-CMP kinase